MEPRQLCSKLLHNCFLGPGFCQGSHVLEVAGRKTLHFGERLVKVLTELIYDLGAPALLLLAEDNFFSDPPIQKNKFVVYRYGRTNLRRSNLILQSGEKILICLGAGDEIRHGGLLIGESNPLVIANAGGARTERTPA